MDPLSITASITGIVLTVEQILSTIYKYGKGVKEAKADSRQLCSELFALKAALEHVKMSLHDAMEEPQSPSHSLLQSSQFRDMLSTAKSMLEDLSKRLTQAPGRINSATYSMKWPFKKDDVSKELVRLERLKSYFVLATTTENMSLCQQTFLEIRSIATVLNEQQEQHSIKSKLDLRTSVLQWLAPYDPTPLYRQALPVEEAGTGRWFLDGPLVKWFSEPSANILWLKGKPGCGKTTLTATAIREAEANNFGEAKRAYFFCSFTDLSSQDLQNMLGSIVAQLCKIETDIWQAIVDMYKAETSQNSGRPKPPSLDHLKGLLKSICEESSGIHLFVDAVNESKDSIKILAVLLSLVEEIPALKLMISSTEELVLPSDHPASGSIMTVAMKTRYIDYDIQQYVRFWLQSHERLKFLPSHLKYDITCKLHSQADGTFRWVQCQLENLVLQKTPKALKAVLDCVPPTLEQTYCNLLTKIPKEDRPLAKNALLWLSFSVRSMKFDELCEALTIDENAGRVDEDARLLEPSDLLKMCSSLISYDTDGQEIVLAHSSVLVYLKSEQIKASEAHEFFVDTYDVENVLLRRCLTYLCSPTFRTGYCQTHELEQRWDEWPLLDYCVETWPIYARYITMDDPTRSLLLKFFETSKYPRCGNFGAWVQAYLPYANMNIENSTPLYYASRFSLNNIVELILAVQGTASLEVRGGRRGSTPLHVACYSGNTEVVKTLLDAGANANEVNDMGEVGLRWAVIRGKESMTRLLLSRGADANHKNTKGYTPLYYAIRHGQKNCTVALLEAAADVKAVDWSDLEAVGLSRDLSQYDDEWGNILARDYGTARM